MSYIRSSLLGGWDRAAGMSGAVLRLELEAGMERLGREMRERNDLDWDGRPRRGSAKRRKAPRLNPTKGYRGAHKLFRGGSR